MSDSEVNLDLERAARTGIAEAVFCAGKSDEQLLTICGQLNANRPMLFTRMSDAQFAVIDAHHSGFLDYDPQSKTAFHLPREVIGTPEVAIVTGGSSDVAVAREAARTLAFNGYACTTIDDIGVAGLWRLMNRLDDIKAHKIVIAVAGMDAALPTVLGGLVPCSIIAVPTSVGYGMSRNGETALNALLVSCSSGITVTNIDNGFGAACAALRILHQFQPLSESS